MAKIAWIGLGKLGLPCAEAFAKRGHEVSGYDIQPVKSHLITMRPTIERAVKYAEFIFIAVPTPHDAEYDGSTPTSHLPPKDFNYTAVKSVLAELNTVVNKEQTVVLVSTVMPGTVRNQLAPLIPKAQLVYNPYLIAMGTVEEDMMDPEMVIIGSEGSQDIFSGNYGPDELHGLYANLINKSGLRIISCTWEEAECIKVFYNTWISAKIGLSNMMMDVAQRVGNANVNVVAEAISGSTRRITSSTYMTPGMGDGGACHPRDNIALRNLSNQLDLGYDLFGSIMGAREAQAQNLASYLVELATPHHYPIYIHGKSYKPAVPYTDGSYSLLVGHYCEQMGFPPIYIDPLSEEGGLFHPTEPGVFLLAHSMTVTYGVGMRRVEDGTVITSKLYVDIPDNSIVVDPWRKLRQDGSGLSNTIEVKHYGNSRPPPLW